MANSREKLFSEFASPTTQEWLDKIQVDLKGADFEKKLVWRTNEGFKVQPFYRREDLKDLKAVDSLPGEYPFVRGNKKDNNLWYVRQDIVVDDIAEANAKALDILNKGIDSLGFRLPSDKVSEADIAKLLDGICPECVELNFQTCQCHSVELANSLVSYFRKSGKDMSKMVGSVNFDPIEKILVKGKDVSRVLENLKPLVEALADLPQYRCVNVNSMQLNNAGAYIYQELGYALAWGNEYMQHMVDAGIDPDTAAKSIKFNMGVSENYFMEIAKFRAGRLLWANIVKQYGPKCDCACKMYVNAVTTEYNQTMYDSYVNLLRSQTEAMSAALANVESIVVTPFDKPYETPDEFSERLARNQQLLLKEEAHFDKIVDVAGGSYYVEHLTDAIAREAWTSMWKTTADSLLWLWKVRFRRLSMLSTQRDMPMPQSVVNSCLEQTSSLTSTRRPTERLLHADASADAVTMRVRRLSLHSTRTVWQANSKHFVSDQEKVGRGVKGLLKA